MNKKVIIVLVSVIFFSNILSREGSVSKTFFSTRSQGSSASRNLVISSYHTSKDDSVKIYKRFYIVGEYQKSIFRELMGTYFFLNGLNEMKVADPIVLGGDLDSFISAYNLGLGKNFKGTVSSLPVTENFVTDFNLLLELNEFTKGLYLRIDAPLVWTRRRMNLVEQVQYHGDPFTPGQVANKSAGAIHPGSKTITEAFKGQGLFGDMKTPWNYGKIDDTKKKSIIRLADIAIALGYKFLNNERGYLGLKIKGIIPTGNKPSSEFIFEPVIGNNRHGEFGIGADVRYDLIKTDWTLSLFLDLNLTHMFENIQKRSFDFKKNGRGSRYLLLKEFTNNLYNQKLVNAINIVTLDTKVKVNAHVDMATMFCIQKEGLKFGLGYNFWARSVEKLKIDENIPYNKYGFLGIVEPYPSGAGSGYLDSNEINNRVSPNIQVNGYKHQSQEFQSIKTSDLNVESGANEGTISHKFFVDTAYSWLSKENTPFIGIGLEIEFTGHFNHSINQWGVFTKGGFCF